VAFLAVAKLLRVGQGLVESNKLSPTYALYWADVQHAETIMSASHNLSTVQAEQQSAN